MSENSFLGAGWSFPPSFDNSNFCVSLTERENNIDQSIDLILQTPRNGRSLVPDFGSELRKFLFQHPDNSLKDEIASSVTATLLNNEPRIEVNTVKVGLLDNNDNTLGIAIDYTVKSTNTRHNHVFPFSLLEGTNLKSTG